MHQPCNPIFHHPSKHIESHLRTGTQLWPALKARTIFVQQVSSAGISEPAQDRCRGAGFSHQMVVRSARAGSPAQ
jgi:hypothetical protein